MQRVGLIGIVASLCLLGGCGGGGPKENPNVYYQQAPNEPNVPTLRLHIDEHRRILTGGTPVTTEQVHAFIKTGKVQRVRIDAYPATPAKVYGKLIEAIRSGGVQRTAIYTETVYAMRDKKVSEPNVEAEADEKAEEEAEATGEEKPEGASQDKPEDASAEPAEKPEDKTPDAPETKSE